MSRFVKSAFLAIVLAAAPALPASADPLNLPYAVKVSLAGLNLDSEAGAFVAVDRIARAAVKACGQSPSPRQLKAHALHRECSEAFTQKAVQQINAPVLTAIYSRTAPAIVAAR